VDGGFDRYDTQHEYERERGQPSRLPSHPPETKQYHDDAERESDPGASRVVLGVLR
jgi:hypothetical protein